MGRNAVALDVSVPAIGHLELSRLMDALRSMYILDSLDLNEDEAHVFHDGHLLTHLAKESLHLTVC